MRVLKLLVLAVLAVALVVIAMANRGLVTLDLLPTEFSDFLGFRWTAEVPLFLVIFGAAAVGLVLGFVWEWLREGKHRKQAATGKRQVTALSREVSRLHEQHAKPKDEVLALLDAPARARKG